MRTDSHARSVKSHCIMLCNGTINRSITRSVEVDRKAPVWRTMSVYGGSCMPAT